jgi:hypothetical protein
VRSISKKTTAILVAGLGVTGLTHAGEVFVTSDITTSTTWTANNTYNLQDQIYVRNGASLTIEAGTIIASDTNLGGSLAVARGSQIFVLGTKEKPVVMTSKADQATWSEGGPRTGVWREAQNEWGNLTIMGEAYISENAVGGNTPTCNAANVADMEGLTNGPSTDRYGGGDDDDDSGTIQYLSIRYGGKRIGLNNELNGLSLGGIGRATDIHHIDIMNNVDDGIEIWGGTVNIKYVNIWNIGDDSIDLDQGWRGKLQFALLVQGYSTQAAQGSGTGDNLFETDGAEQSDYQPVTTGVIYNVTAIGQPISGDHGTAWRDNCRLQYRNCIFMNLGERLVSLDNVDGDGGLGYGFNGTLSWAATWTTDYNAVPAHANDCLPRSTYYKAQTSGKLAEIKDSVFYSNLNASAYTTAATVGVTPGNGTNNNVVEPANSPIRFIQRAANVSYLGLTMQRVVRLDPRPANDAITSVAAAPSDGFFTPAQYRGAFRPDQGALEVRPWICGWTASDAFGFVEPCATAAKKL